jgi:hypothetical protein
MRRSRRPPDHPLPQRTSLPPRDRRRARAGRADAACRTIRAGWATGTSACRRRGRWTPTRVPPGQPAGRQRRGRRGARDDGHRAHTALQRDAIVALTGARMRADLDGLPFATGSATRCGRQRARLGPVQGPGRALSRGAGRPRRARSTWAAVHLHARPVRRPRWTGLRLGDVLHLLPRDAAGRARACRRTGSAADLATGRSACSTDRTAHPTSSQRATSTPSSPPTGRCTTTPAAPACA